MVKIDKLRSDVQGSYNHDNTVLAKTRLSRIK